MDSSSFDIAGQLTNDLINSMEMTFNNENKLISVTSSKYDYSSSENSYMRYTFGPVCMEPIGTLLISFLESDFNTLMGFKEYVLKWGINGLFYIIEKSNNDICGSDEIGFNKYIDGVWNASKNSLIKAQNLFKKLIDFCNNTENKDYLNDLSSLQRFLIFYNNEKNINIINTYSANIKIRYGVRRDYLNITDCFNESQRDEIELAKIIQLHNVKIDEIYYSKDVRSLCYLEFITAISDFNIQKCGNCSNYFIPYDKAEKYCNRLLDNNKTCKDIGYINKVKNNNLLNSYNTAYKTKHAQKQRNSRNKSKITIEKYETAFNEWRENAKKELAKAQNEYALAKSDTDRKFVLDEFKKNYLDKELEV